MGRQLSTPTSPILPAPAYLCALCALRDKNQPAISQIRNNKQRRAFFSITSTMLLPQPFSFHGFALLPGVGIPHEGRGAKELLEVRLQGTHIPAVSPEFAV
jgi:hypothetical protein